MELPVEIKKPRRGRPPKTREEKNQAQDVAEAAQSAEEKPSAAAVTEEAPVAAAAAAAGKIVCSINKCGCPAAL